MFKAVTMAAMLVMIMAAGSTAAASPVDDRTAIEKAAGMEAAPGAEEEPAQEEYSVVTGLDFAMWWMGDLRLAGPGLAVGFVLVPDHFEMYLSFGAMLGSRVYLVPVELTFAVPFRVARWLDIYIDFGPTLLLDKAHGELTPDWALSAGAGLEILPPGFDWGIYLEGDYNFRFQQAIDHQGGFSVGFRYRF